MTSPQVDPADSMRRFVLGTVQLGIPYGRLRHHELMPRSAAFAILDTAWQLGIRTFDTADAYGASAIRLRAWLDQRATIGAAHVITKVSPDADSEFIATIVARFTGAASITVLSHGPLDDIGWEAFLATAETAGVAAGQSVYAAGEIRQACGLLRMSRIQAPANVLDRRSLEARGSSPVPLDLRSVFLQGVLLDDPVVAEHRVRGAGRVASAVRVAAAVIARPAAELCVAAVLHALQPADRLVVGVDTPAQLEVLSAAAGIQADVASGFAARLQRELGDMEAAILDPRTW